MSDLENSILKDIDNHAQAATGKARIVWSDATTAYATAACESASPKSWDVNRQIDRALQRMRKAGRIAYVKGAGWVRR